MEIFDWIRTLYDPEKVENLLKGWDWLAYLVLFAIIFAETGLLVGFFLPGDSLLFVAGFSASLNILNIYILIPVLFAAAMLGDSSGYWIGRKTGHRIFKKEKSRLFHPEHIAKTERFYHRHGGKAIIMARFVPIMRTFVPFMGGVAKMDYKRFVSYDLVGGVLWAIGVPMIGYKLGKLPWVKDNLEKALLGVVLVSFLPLIIEIVRHKFFPDKPEDLVVQEVLDPNDFK